MLHVTDYVLVLQVMARCVRFWPPDSISTDVKRDDGEHISSIQHKETRPLHIGLWPIHLTCLGLIRVMGSKIVTCFPTNQLMLGYEHKRLVQDG